MYIYINVHNIKDVNKWKSKLCYSIPMASVDHHREHVILYHLYVAW